MDPIDQRLAAIDEKLDRIERTTAKTYKIFLVTVIVAVVSFVLPLIGLAFVIPQVIGAYSSALGL